MKKLLSLPNLLFATALLIELIPAERTANNSLFYFSLIIIIEVFYILSKMFNKDKSNSQTIGDITSIVFVLMIIWELFTAKFNILDKLLFPAPGIIVSLLIFEMPELIKGLFSSMQLLLGGYLLALFVAIPLALLIGWRRRLYNAVNPLTKVLGPIPPIVYIPYAIALLPTFKLSSILLIFIGAFWPIFINILNGVFNVDKRLIDSAKALNVKERSMLFHVILPATMPSIISGATIGLVMSFILLTAAEMIGATSGLGWYVKYYSDFADYSRVIVGIIFIGFVVTLITLLFNKLEKYLLRWK